MPTTKFICTLVEYLQLYICTAVRLVLHDFTGGASSDDSDFNSQASQPSSACSTPPGSPSPAATATATATTAATAAATATAAAGKSCGSKPAVLSSAALAFKEAEALEGLQTYIQQLGGQLGAGWDAKVTHRQDGSTKDKLFIAPSGKRFRSYLAVAKELKLDVGKRALTACDNGLQIV